MTRAVRLTTAAAAAAVLLFLTGSPASSEVLSRFRAHGAHALVAWEDGPISGFLSVSQDSTSASRAATFVFYALSVDGEPFELGFGYVANKDLSGSPSQAVTLATNTGGIAGPAFNVVLGTGGPITVVWQRDASGFESGGSGSSWTRIGTVTTRQNGHSVFYGASVEGTVLGFPITGNILDAHLGRHTNVMIEVSRGR